MRSMRLRSRYMCLFQRMRQLEAVDGTPIIDLKPILSEDIGRR